MDLSRCLLMHPHRGECLPKINQSQRKNLFGAAAITLNGASGAYLWLRHIVRHARQEITKLACQHSWQIRRNICELQEFYPV